MMRLWEYSSLLCIWFAEGVTSWKAEWLWIHCCCVQQMWVGHSSHFLILQVFRAFVLHWGDTPTKQNQCQNSPQIQQNRPSHSFPGVFWRNRRYLATKHLQWNLRWPINIFQGSEFLTNKFRNTYLPFIFQWYIQNHSLYCICSTSDKKKWWSSFITNDEVLSALLLGQSSLSSQGYEVPCERQTFNQASPVTCRFNKNVTPFSFFFFNSFIQSTNLVLINFYFIEEIRSQDPPNWLSVQEGIFLALHWFLKSRNEGNIYLRLLPFKLRSLQSYLKNSPNSESGSDFANRLTLILLCISLHNAATQII